MNVFDSVVGHDPKKEGKLGHDRDQGRDNVPEY
jgi:hypothetical protein